MQKTVSDFLEVTNNEFVAVLLMGIVGVFLLSMSSYLLNLSCFERINKPTS